MGKVHSPAYIASVDALSRKSKERELKHENKKDTTKDDELKNKMDLEGGSGVTKGISFSYTLFCSFFSSPSFHECLLVLTWNCLFFSVFFFPQYTYAQYHFMSLHQQISPLSFMYVSTSQLLYLLYYTYSSRQIALPF